MRVRETRPASLPAPPEALLMFTDPSRPDPGGPGMDAYAGRGEWLAARRDWEARHKMTVAAWSEATLGELTDRAGSLDELSEAVGLCMFEPDDEKEWLL